MKNSRVRAIAIAVATAAALAVAGCGGSDSPEDVVSNFYTAVGDGDFEAVCDLLSEGAAQATIDEEGAETCEEAAEASLEGAGAASELLDQIEVGEATIDGESGTVEISFAGQSDTVNVVQEDDEWKVDDQ